MAAIQRQHLGIETGPRLNGHTVHGRWSAFYVRAASTANEARAAFFGVQDAERWAFALAEGDGAGYMAECLAEYLWTLRGAGDDWPATLHAWLANAEHWRGAEAGAVRFACGRIERARLGGNLALAWLGLRGVCLLTRHGAPLTLDTEVATDEVWTPQTGGDLPALHSYRAPLIDAARLVLLSASAAPLTPSLPDMTTPDVELALEPLASDAPSDLALFDLWLPRPPVAAESVVVQCRWTGPAQCELVWEQLPQATGYRIEQAATPDFAAPGLLAELADGRQVRYSFAPPAEGAPYYRVVPLIGAGQGLPGAPVAALPLTLPAPVMGSPRWAREGALRLHWTPVPMATSYEVEGAPSDDFAESGGAIVYRGERAEVTLPPDTPLGQFYRVRALNTLFAPGAPSAWSQPVRGPLRLATPVFTQITARRLAWERVPGAGGYEVRVTPPGLDPEQGEDVVTTEAECPAASGPASYQVRALRGRGEERGVSEWSAPVTIAPHAAMTRRTLAIPALIAVALAALAVGLGLGAAGVEAYRAAQATESPAPVEGPVAAACVVVARPTGVRLPVYAAPDDASSLRAADLPRLAIVHARLDGERDRWRAVLGRMAVGTAVAGWVRLPDGLDEAALYGGACDPESLPVGEG